MSGHGHVTPNPDGRKARCGGPAACATCAQEAFIVGYQGDSPPKSTCPACGQPIPSEVAVRATESTSTEALIGGQRSVSDVKELVRQALKKRIADATGVTYAWVSIIDFTANGGGGEVVYACDDDALHQSSYAVADDGTVTLGEPAAVSPAYVPTPTPGVDAAMGEDGVAAESVTETRALIESIGQVVEAKGNAADGGRIFRVRVIAYGDSKNGRRYPETVMREAAPIYEGAKAFDHHRTLEEMRSGTIAGLVGTYRGVAAEADGLYGDLHLLPSATHAAEALDAALAAQTEGLDPLVGISHDIQGLFRPVTENGRQVQEAMQIVKVNSADVVSHPAAGGQATRVVAGGIDAPDGDTTSSTEAQTSTTPNEPAGVGPDGQSTKESDVTVNAADVLAALQNATPAELAAVGLSKAGESTAPVTPPVEKPAEQAVEVAAPTFGKTSFMGRMAIKSAVEDAALPAKVAESLTDQLPEQFTEADLTARIAGLKDTYAVLERSGLTPTVTTQVTKESVEKKRDALDKFFAGDYIGGYRSFKEAFSDITGQSPRAFDEDFNRLVLRESIGSAEGYDSGRRSTESLDSTSWAQVLGDSVTRRVVAEYGLPQLQTWRQIVSSIVPVNDFRTQRVGRVGGYGTLPTVAEGAPYQPLTSPPDEEATYAPTKKGGTEDLTMEMIANDDVRAISNIPKKLGRAAAQTLYRFVWDMLASNVTCTYDSTVLFHTNHSNTTTPATLSQSNLSTLRKLMRQQTAYGDSSEVLGFIPRFLAVPSALEEIAFQLCTSAVAVPSTPAGPSDTPNLHAGLTHIVLDYWSDANDWFVIADPAMCPTIELGFYRGQETPELFTQVDPTQGSMWSTDSVGYKVRHIYSGTALDHRAFQRAVN